MNAGPTPSRPGQPDGDQFARAKARAAARAAARQEGATQ